jgi:hypothetical protein
MDGFDATVPAEGGTTQLFDRRLDVEWTTLYLILHLLTFLR